MKKKTVANLVMIAIIIVIAAAGLLGVGHIRGWFDNGSGDVALLTQIRGVVNLERSGTVFPAEGGTVLRAGDRITTRPGASTVIAVGDTTVTLGGSTELTVENPNGESLGLYLSGGEAFVNSESPVQISFELGKALVEKATAALSVRSGAQTVSVFRGSVGEADAGKSLEYTGGEVSLGTMRLDSLNDFLLSQIRAANETVMLCYTNEELDALAEKRQQALQELINSMKPTQPEQTDPPQPELTEPAGTEPMPTEPAPTNPKPTDPKPTDPKPTDPKPTDPAATEPTATEPAQTQPASTQPETQPPREQPAGSCYITIRCDTILDNMGSLTPGKAEFVPADGIILPVVEVPFYEGATVFEVLKRVCQIADIQLEYSWTPLYNSYYIEGINHLYEFDCGEQSGWMYKVNEWFPNYGCSSYEVGDGDVIVWCYTCNGLGADVGGPEW